MLKPIWFEIFFWKLSTFLEYRIWKLKKNFKKSQPETPANDTFEFTKGEWCDKYLFFLFNFWCLYLIFLKLQTENKLCQLLCPSRCTEASTFDCSVIMFYFIWALCTSLLNFSPSSLSYGFLNYANDYLLHTKKMFTYITYQKKVFIKITYSWSKI